MWAGVYLRCGQRHHGHLGIGGGRDVRSTSRYSPRVLQVHGAKSGERGITFYVRSLRMDGWVDGWMGGWVGGWIDGWMDGWMGGWVDRMDGWMGGGGVDG